MSDRLYAVLQSRPMEALQGRTYWNYLLSALLGIEFFCFW